MASRIRVIQTMVNSDTGSAEVTFDVTQAIADAGSGDFEAFGAVYQAAVATHRARPARRLHPSHDLRSHARLDRAPGARRRSHGHGRVDDAARSLDRCLERRERIVDRPDRRVRDDHPAGRARVVRQRAHPRRPRSSRSARAAIVSSAPAAQAWRACVEAARADGIDLTITDSYRTFDQQVDLVQRKGLYSNGGYGATPGTSNHGWGLAVDADVTAPQTLDWMRANAYKFGFVEAVPREPWHWEFRPQQA